MQSSWKGGGWQGVHTCQHEHTHTNGERETQGRQEDSRKQELGQDVAQTLETLKIKRHCPRPLPRVHLSRYHLKQAGVPKPGQHRQPVPGTERSCSWALVRTGHKAKPPGIQSRALTTTMPWHSCGQDGPYRRQDTPRPSTFLCGVHFSPSKPTTARRLSQNHGHNLEGPSIHTVPQRLTQFTLHFN